MKDLNLIEEYNYDLFLVNTYEEVVDLIKKGADVNFVNYKGFTPLSVARNVDVAKALVELGADVNFMNNEGETPIFHNSNIDVVSYLVSCGAKINQRNNKGQTVLFKTNKLLNVARLINMGCNPFLKSVDGHYHYENMTMADRKNYSQFIEVFKNNVRKKNEERMLLSA
ncbi:ankyrin repeat domain-containing protein [Enterobacter kobei]|uniref:ankyrin repeat domain-containing protein n=1 Tax=Enterobacter kobei TaxID=208224 RepID=UPI002005D2A7|nr:ankyrin repeat domain-containing protein [Enterobacter kobei]MCK6816700.1 ankyrin repeat domain-containing protein [Enterobacter kobei]